MINRSTDDVEPKIGSMKDKITNIRNRSRSRYYGKKGARWRFAQRKQRAIERARVREVEEVEAVEPVHAAKPVENATPMETKIPWRAPNRISQVRAREMFPMLVARAKERKTISYGELTEHFDLAWAMPMMYAVVCTTGTLYDLERNKLPQAQFAWTHGKIPRIANMVTKSNGAPAGFVADQVPYQEPLIDFDTLLRKIWNYDKWDEVQKALGLSG